MMKGLGLLELYVLRKPVVKNWRLKRVLRPNGSNKSPIEALMRDLRSSKPSGTLSSSGGSSMGSYQVIRE